MEKKLDLMLVSTFLTTIFYASTYPFIHRLVMNSISDRLLALNQIFVCLCVVIIGKLWNTYSDKLFNYYPHFCIGEIILDIFTICMVFYTHSIIAYYILDTIVASVVVRNISCGCIKLKTLRYTSETEREHFDNNMNSVSSVATIIGSLFAMGLNLNFNTMLILATIGTMIDNFFYLKLFYDIKRQKEAV